MVMNKLKKISLLLGPLVWIFCRFGLPQDIFQTIAERDAIGIAAWMSIWWITAPVDYAVTALIPIGMNAILQMTDMSSVVSNYASDTVMLLLGASIMSISWEETGLDQKIAQTIIKHVGNNYRRQIIFWFLICTVLSAILPNAIVCASIVPIAVTMLKYVGEEDIAHSKKGSKILLTIVYAVGVGGLASPLGGAMNLIIVNYLEMLTGTEYMYASWVVRFLPIMLVLVISNICFLMRDTRKGEKISETIIDTPNTSDDCKMTSKQIASLALFMLATILAFTRQLYAEILPGLKPAYVFIICASLSFLILGKDSGMTWKKVQTKIGWDMLLIFAGGMAIGTLINNSGAANSLSNYISTLNLNGGIGTVAIILGLTILLSDITSNTATAAITIPLVISIAQGLELNAVPYVYIASIGVNLSYMLPTSIRAIPVGYGLSPKYMFREGWKLTVIVWALMTVTSYFLLCFWDLYSTV